MMKALFSAILSASLISCSLEPQASTSKLDDAPVRINESAIPTSSSNLKKADSSTKQNKPVLKPTGKLGYRTPDLVNTLPTEAQTTGSAPKPDTIDEDVDSSTTIRADAE